MDHIAVYVDGRSVVNRGSGFAVILISTNSRWERSLSYGMFTVNAADLLAVKFSILSVAKPFSKLPLKIHTKNQYVVDMMAKEGDIYTMLPKANLELVDEVRTLIANRNVEFIVNSDDQNTKKCHDLVMAAIKDNQLTNYRK